MQTNMTDGTVAQQVISEGWGDRIDRWINYFKWPVAIAAVLMLPAFCWSGLLLTARLIHTPSWSMIPFGLGTIAFIFLWRKLLGNLAIGRWLVTMEHEVTHGIFAFLTGHKIVSIRATMGNGGELRYAGRGNWLITAAPYFFPTAAIVLSVVAYLLPFSGLPWPSFLLGVALGYHLVSTYRETHGEQTDLKELGRTFAWMFIPSANLATVAFLIAFAYAGTAGVQTWLADTRQPFVALTAWLQSLYVSGGA
jgi:Peptidase M50B-like